MHRVLQLITGSAIAALSLWPVASSAQSVDSSVSVDQVRAAFAGVGYQVEAPLTWDWTHPQVSTFRVHDMAHDRVLLVLVYPNANAALVARRQAEANEQLTLAGRSVARSGDGPHLVTSYGPSTWHGNVALVQTTESALDRAFRLQNDRDSTMADAPAPELPPATVAVDVDFLQALDTSIAAL